MSVFPLLSRRPHFFRFFKLIWVARAFKFIVRPISTVSIIQHFVSTIIFMTEKSSCVVLKSHKGFLFFYSRHDPQQLCFNFGQCDSASADSTRHLQEQHLEGKDLRGKQNCSHCLNVTSITKRQIAKVCNFLKNSNSIRESTHFNIFIWFEHF